MGRRRARDTLRLGDHTTYPQRAAASTREMAPKVLDRSFTDSSPDHRNDIDASTAHRSIDDPFCILVWKFHVEPSRARSFERLHRESAQLLAEQPKALFQRITQKGDAFDIHVGLEDSYGVLAHVSMFGEFLEGMGSMGRYLGVEVYGPAGELASLRDPLLRLRPRFVEHDGDNVI